MFGDGHCICLAGQRSGSCQEWSCVTQADSVISPGACPRLTTTACKLQKQAAAHSARQRTAVVEANCVSRAESLAW